MGNLQNLLKNKARVLAIAAMILEVLALATTFVLFLNQETVFDVFAGPREKLRLDFKFFLLSIYPYLLSVIFSVVYYFWVSNAQKHCKAVSIIFIFFHVALFSVVNMILSMFINLRIGRLGYEILAAYSVMGNATGVVTAAFSTVAAILFYISCGFMIAYDYSLRDNKKFVL